jgi:hypothetical protein
VQDDLRNGGEFVVRTPEARAGSPFQYCMGFETYLVRDRFDLGRQTSRSRAAWHGPARRAKP